MKNVYVNILCFFHSFIVAKYLLKVLAVSWGLVKVSPLSRNNTVGTLDATVFRETSDLISFQVILILFQFFSKYL